MEDVHEVLKFKALSDGKSFAISRVAAYHEAHPGMLAENIVHISSMVARCKTLLALATMMSNTLLSHPSENLGVI